MFVWKTLFWAFVDGFVGEKCFWVASRSSGWMAERSKAPVSGTGLFGGVGSNPTPIIFWFCICSELRNIHYHAQHWCMIVPWFFVVAVITLSLHARGNPRQQFCDAVNCVAPHASNSCCGLVGYDARFTRERSPVRSWAAVFFPRLARKFFVVWRNRARCTGALV